MTFFALYAIGVGHNIALNSLVNLESITVSGDNKPFPAPMAIPHGSPGQRRGRLTGLGYRAGYPTVDWVYGVLTYNQYMYLRNTYCGGGFSSEVTIYTTVSGLDYARYNAIMDIPETAALSDGFFAPHPVPIHMTHLEPL